MIFHTSFFLLSFIAVHLCHSTDVKSECRGGYNKLVAESLGSWAACCRHFRHYPAQCEEIISRTEYIQATGLFHNYKSLLLVNRTITIGGHLIIPNLNSYKNRSCDLKQIPECQKRQWLDEKRWGFYDQQQEKLANFSRSILETQSPMKYVSPIVDENWKLLPFPNMFNITILKVKPLKLCNRTVRPIACHLMLNDDCLFRTCHSDHALQIIQLTVKYQQLAVDLLMTCHLESIAHYQQQNPIYNILKQDGGLSTLCHFASPQTNFYLCDQ